MPLPQHFADIGLRARARIARFCLMQQLVAVARACAAAEIFTKTTHRRILRAYNAIDGVHRYQNVLHPEIVRGKAQIL